MFIFLYMFISLVHQNKTFAEINTFSTYMCIVSDDIEFLHRNMLIPFIVGS
jgi:hypothetical protein